MIQPGRLHAGHSNLTWAVASEAEGGAVRAPKAVGQAVLGPVQQEAEQSIGRLESRALHQLMGLVLILSSRKSRDQFHDVPSVSVRGTIVCNRTDGCQLSTLNT